MNIAINLLPFRGNLAGAGNYAKNIVLELSRLDKKNNYQLFVSKEGEKHFHTENPSFKIIVNPFNSSLFIIRIFWEQLVFPFQLLFRKIDILFTPSVAIPVFYTGKMVTTIHDIAFKKVKQKYPWPRRVYLSFITGRALQKSDLIYTVSEFSKQEILENYPIRPGKILVTYNGVNPVFYMQDNKESLEKIRQKYKLPEKYLLYVGAIEPGKNLEMLVKVFKSIVATSKIPDLFLVMTGGLGWKGESVKSLLKTVKEKVVLLPFIPDEELPAIYKMSEILVYISFYEGFGLPVLEAMASGVPVVVSDFPAIKEFAKKSAIFVNPEDEKEIEKAIFSLLSDKSKREELKKEGIKASTEFSWRKSASIIINSFTNA